MSTERSFAGQCRQPTELSKFFGLALFSVLSTRCPREDKGSSLRFEAAEVYNTRHGLAADAASQKIGAVLEKGREVLTAAQAERERIEAERLRQAEELKKAQELKRTFRPGRGPSMGM